MTIGILQKEQSGSHDVCYDLVWEVTQFSQCAIIVLCCLWTGKILKNTQAALVCEHHRVHLHKPRWPGLLHNQTIGYSPLCLGYKPVQQVNTQNDVKLNQVREKMMQSRCGKEEMYEDAAGRTRDNVLQQTFFCNWKVCTPTKSIVSA